MPQRAEYKVISGGARKIDKEISLSATQGFKPILVTSTGTGNNFVIVIVLERVLES